MHSDAKSHRNSYGNKKTTNQLNNQIISIRNISTQAYSVFLFFLNNFCFVLIRQNTLQYSDFPIANRKWNDVLTFFFSFSFACFILSINLSFKNLIIFF